MKVIQVTPNIAFTVHFGISRESGWELATTIGGGVLTGPNLLIRVLVIGWGWDDEIPLRPWPQWCGFFVTLAKEIKDKDEDVEQVHYRLRT